MAGERSKSVLYGDALPNLRALAAGSAERGRMVVRPPVEGYRPKVA